MANYQVPDNWASLPIKEAIMGGQKKKVKIDENLGVIYLLDERGDWTGEKYRNPKSNNATSDNAAAHEGTTGNENSEGSDTESEKPIRRKKAKSKLTPVLVIIIIILGGLLALQNMDGATHSKTYNVIVAMQNIQPGESIEGKLAQVEIGADEYHKYASAGGLYLAAEYNSIQNYVATSFIPKNSYVAYGNVGRSFQAANPWTLPGGKTEIILPINLDKDKLEEFIWGNKVTIIVEARKTLNTEDYPDAYRPGAPEVTGSSKLQTIQVDTYRLEGITIVDMLNTQKKSLYSTYLAMSTIPEIYRKDHFATRYSSVEAVHADTPAYIKVAVDEETADWWKHLTSAAFRYTVSVILEPTGVNCETSFQSETYTAINAILPGIQDAWANATEEE